MAEYLNSKERMESAKEIVEGYEYSWAKKEFDFWTDLYNCIINEKIGSNWSNKNKIIYDSRCIKFKKEKELNQDKSIEKILKYRFNDNKYRHIGIAFKKKVNDYTIYTILGYYNGEDCSWMGIEIEKDGKCLSPDEIIKLLGSNLGLTEKDDISIFKTFTELTFASKDNLSGTFDLFDEKGYSELVNNFADKMVGLIKEIDKSNL